MLSGRARGEQLFKYLCESVITILILSHFQEKCVAHNTVILDVLHPPPYTNNPLPSSLFLYLCICAFPLFFFFSAVPWTPSLSLTPYLLQLVSFSVFSFPRTASLVVSFSASLPHSCLSVLSYLSFSGLALQCSWCWNASTHQNLSLLMCLALARCHTLQISAAIPARWCSRNCWAQLMLGVYQMI